MPRRIEVVVPHGEADSLMARMQEVEGVTGVSVQRAASVSPPGDIVTFVTTNDASRRVLGRLAEDRVHERGAVHLSELRVLLSKPHEKELSVEGSEQNWEEMGVFLRREVNPTPNFFGLMVLSGIMAGIGLWADTLHLVVGAMILAPGFEPLLRIPFGLIAGPLKHSRQGAVATLGGYAALAVGAAVALLLLRVADPTASPDLESRFWVRYWSTITPAGAFMGLVAGAAGILTVMAERPVLTAGVMVALALVPAMAIVGFAAASLDAGLAAAALARWAVDAAAVIVSTTAVAGAKKRIIHRRSAVG